MERWASRGEPGMSPQRPGLHPSAGIAKEAEAWLAGRPAGAPWLTPYLTVLDAAAGIAFDECVQLPEAVRNDRAPGRGRSSAAGDVLRLPRLPGDRPGRSHLVLRH